MSNPVTPFQAGQTPQPRGGLLQTVISAQPVSPFTVAAKDAQQTPYPPLADVNQEGPRVMTRAVDRFERERYEALLAMFGKLHRPQGILGYLFAPFTKRFRMVLHLLNQIHQSLSHLLGDRSAMYENESLFTRSEALVKRLDALMALRQQEERDATARARRLRDALQHIAEESPLLLLARILKGEVKPEEHAAKLTQWHSEIIRLVREDKEMYDPATGASARPPTLTSVTTAQPKAQPTKARKPAVKPIAPSTPPPPAPASESAAPAAPAAPEQ